MSTMDVVASCIRAGITAPPGKKLVVCDLASIESRVLGWLSGCLRLNNLFAQGLDPYIDFATETFQALYDQVTKEQRTLAKPAVLGCGYRLGAIGLVKYADSMKIAMDRKQAKQAVQTFRHVYSEVPQMWYWLDEVVNQVIDHHTVVQGYGVAIWRDDQFLMVQLPSGRNLYYYQPQVLLRTITILDDETGEERRWQKMSPTYMGMNQYTHKWTRVDSHGGKFTENIVQATAREMLAQGMQLLEQDPLAEQVGHVHDELIGLADEANADTALTRLKGYMSQPIEWAPGLLLGADGYVAQRYRKG